MKFVVAYAFVIAGAIILLAALYNVETEHLMLALSVAAFLVIVTVVGEVLEYYGREDYTIGIWEEKKDDEQDVN